MTATEPTEATTGIPFTLNGKAMEAKPGEMLIDACERNGEHIPRFCYHPRMKPVGMCRMCLVEVDTGRGPGLQPSCMLTVSPDMVVNTESESTKQAQDGILELTLINHPLDCPVCDKGGECPLQDNAYSYGPGESRFVEEKRHYEKPIPISDLVYLDRERCILCDRCTRFADEVAGDPLIHFMDRGAQTQVNTFPDHPFSSYFSGNTVQICPVGALTAQPYRFKARPWDLAEIESTSTVDSTGARIVLQSSGDRLVRVLGVDSEAVNWSWLSDKDRFGYEANDSENRLTDAMIDNGEGLEPARWTDAARKVATALAAGPDRTGVIGGARLPLEGQYAWAKLLRQHAQIQNIDAQLGDGLPAQVMAGLPKATIAEATAAGGVVVLLGVDAKEELPSLFLRLRHAAVEDGASLIELTPRTTGLAPHAAVSAHPVPGTVGTVVAALADGNLDQAVGGVEPATLSAMADLLGSDRPVTIVVGRGNLAESADFTVDALAAFARLVPSARYLSGLRRGNVHGALAMGLSPGAVDGLDTEGILRGAATGKIDTIVLLGADPLADFPDRALAERALERVDNIIAVDTFLTESGENADVVLPAAGFGEVDGSFVNLEGRLSPLQAKVTPPGQARADWMIAAEVAAATGSDLGFISLEELRADLSASVSDFASVDWDGLATSDDGPVVVTTGDAPDFGDPVVAPSSDGYGLRLVVDRKLWDLGTMVQQSPSLANLPAEATLALSPSDFSGLGITDGTDVTVETRAGSFTVPARADAGVPKGAAHIPFRLPGFDAGSLIDAGVAISEIRVTVG